MSLRLLLNLRSLETRDPPGAVEDLISYFPGPGLYRSVDFIMTSRGFENLLVEDRKAPLALVDGFSARHVA